MKIIQLLFLFIILISCNKLTEKTTFYKNGKMKERYFVDANGKKQGVYRSFHKNGKIHEYEEYENDMTNGIYKEFYETGIIEGVFHSKNDKLEGELKLFSKKGTLIYYAVYFNDSVGIEKKFYLNGHLKSVRSYRRISKELNPFQYSDENGQIHTNIDFNEKGEKSVNYRYGEWRKISSTKIELLLFNSHFSGKDSTLIQFKKNFNDTKSIREVWHKGLHKFIIEINEQDYYNNRLNIVVGNYIKGHIRYDKCNRINYLPGFDNYYFQIDKGEQPKKFNLDYIDAR